MIVSLSAPNLAHPYPAHIEDLVAVGVLGVLVHIVAVGASTVISVICLV